MNTTQREEKVTKTVAFLNEFHSDVEHSKRIIKSKYCSSRKMNVNTLNWLEELGKCKQVAPGQWETYYSKNDVKLFKLAEQLVDKERKYWRERDQAKKDRKAALDKVNKDLAAIPTPKKEIQQPLVDAFQQAITETITKNLNLNVKVNIKWSIDYE